MKAIPKSKAKTAYGLLSEIRALILAEPKRYHQGIFIDRANEPVDDGFRPSRGCPRLLTGDGGDLRRDGQSARAFSRGEVGSRSGSVGEGGRLAVQHVPGPWTVKRIDYSKKRDVSFEIVAGRDLVVQTIMREIATETDLIVRDEANTRLIAAAPALLEELVAARAYVVEVIAMAGDLNANLSGMHKRLQSIDAVIAKAQGKS